MDLFVTPLAAGWHPPEGYSPSILFPNIAPPPLTAAQRGEQDQEDSTDRRSNSNEDRLVPIEPAGETVAAIAVSDIRWTGGGEVVQEGLAAGGVDTLQSNFDKVVVSFDEFRGREELDVWVGNFILLAVDKVTEIDERIGISEESHSQNQVIVGVSSDSRLERTDAKVCSVLVPVQGGIQGMDWDLHTTDREGEVDLNVTGKHPSLASAVPNVPIGRAGNPSIDGIRNLPWNLR